MRERKDKLKNKAKVIKEIINNPLATVREIAIETGVGSSTVQRNIEELAQNGIKDDRILGVCEIDLQIVTKGQERLLEKLNSDDKMNTYEIVTAIDNSTKRYSLFKGKATDNEGGLNSVMSVIIE